MIGYIYLVITLCSLGVSRLIFKHERQLWRVGISVLFSIIISSIIGSIWILKMAESVETEGTSFISATWDGEKLVTENFEYYIEDSSLVTIDTITGITKATIKKEVPNAGGPWKISIHLGNKKILKIHLTDGEYRSWKSKKK